MPDVADRVHKYVVAFLPQVAKYVLQIYKATVELIFDVPYTAAMLMVVV